MDDTVGRLQSIFSSHQIDVIIGSLLGDAGLECRSIGVRSPVTARLRMHHGAKQKEYVWWKYEMLKDVVSREPQTISWTNPKRNLEETSWYFHTRSMEELGDLYHYFYHNGVKILPESIFSLCNPRMMSVWYMDDGSNNGDNITLNTHGFSKEDQERIREFLQKRFRIQSKVVKDRTKWKITIRKDFGKFISIVQPYVIPSMIYKIANPRNDLSAVRGQSEETIFANTSVPEMENLEKV